MLWMHAALMGILCEKTKRPLYTATHAVHEYSYACHDAAS